MKAEQFEERKVEVGGWSVNLASYKLGETWHCRADNVSPGAGLARASGSTRAEAEDKALRRAEDLLRWTRRHPV